MRGVQQPGKQLHYVRLQGLLNNLVNIFTTGNIWQHFGGFYFWNLLGQFDQNLEPDEKDIEELIRIKKAETPKIVLAISISLCDFNA